MNPIWQSIINNHQQIEREHMSYFSLTTDAFMANRRSGAQAHSAMRCPVRIEKHQGRGMTLDANVRQAQSFFPRMPASFTNVLQRLGLCGARSAPEPLNETERNNRETYRRFRMWEQNARMPLLRGFQANFDDIGLFAGKTNSLHREFGRRLTSAFGELFPTVLREIRAGHPGLKFADALCKAYVLTAHKVAKSIDDGFAPYAAAMKIPIEKIASEARAALEPDVTLSWDECGQFKDIRSEACDDIVRQHRQQFEADKGPLVWPREAVGIFKSTYSDDFAERILQLPRDGISRKALHEIHRRAMESATEAAIETAVLKNEIRPEYDDLLRGLLGVVCNEIDIGIGQSAAARMTGLAQA